MRTTSAPAAARALTCADGGLDVLRVRGRHALHGDRLPGADGDRADANRAGWIALNVHHFRILTTEARRTQRN